MHNSFMCVKINFANEFGDLCDIQGVDPIKVVELTFDESSDGRLLTTSHMRAGPPFSGTCLPKDSAILHGMLKQRLILHRCPTLASAYGFNRDRIVRTFKVAADGVQSVGVIGMGYRPGYLDARHSLAIEFAKVASREGKQVKFWDRQFSKMDRDEYHLAARRDLEVEAIHRRLVGTIEEVLECDSLIVNAPLEPHEFDKVAAFAEAGRRVVDLYRNGLGHA
jgi:UDP-glucose 6-dehydrogenase